MHISWVISSDRTNLWKIIEVKILALLTLTRLVKKYHSMTWQWISTKVWIHAKIKSWLKYGQLHHSQRLLTFPSLSFCHFLRWVRGLDLRAIIVGQIEIRFSVNELVFCILYRRTNVILRESMEIWPYTYSTLGSTLRFMS